MIAKENMKFRKLGLKYQSDFVSVNVNRNRNNRTIDDQYVSVLLFFQMKIDRK